MKCQIIQWLGARRKSADDDAFIHTYVVQAENGVIEEEETEDIALPVGYVIELPDDEWQIDSEWFTIKCDKCGYVYEKKSVGGYTIKCPICNTEEKIPL